MNHWDELVVNAMHYAVWSLDSAVTRKEKSYNIIRTDMGNADYKLHNIFLHPDSTAQQKEQWYAHAGVWKANGRKKATCKGFDITKPVTTWTGQKPGNYVVISAIMTK